MQKKGLHITFFHFSYNYLYFNSNEKTHTLISENEHSFTLSEGWNEPSQASANSSSKMCGSFFSRKKLDKMVYTTYKVINLPLSFKSSTNRIHLHKDKKVHSQTEGPHKETPTSPRLEYGLEKDIIKTAK